MRRLQGTSALTLIAAMLLTHTCRADDWDDLIQGWLKAREIDKQAKRVYDPASKTLNTLPNALQGDPIVSDNEWINKVRKHISEVNAEIAAVSQRSSQEWIIWSGTNLFSIKQTSSAVRKLQNERSKYTTVYGKCEVLKTAVIAVNTADNMDVKRLGRNLTSLKLLDIEARKETLNELNRCMRNAQKLSNRLNDVLATVTQYLDDMVKAREKFDKNERRSSQIPDPVPVYSPTLRAEAGRSSATLQMWQQVRTEPPQDDFTKPLIDPIAAQTEYSTPAGSSSSGFTVHQTPSSSRGITVFNDNFWSSVGNERSTLQGAAPKSHIGQGGGWDNLYPSRSNVRPPIRSTPLLP